MPARRFSLAVVGVALALAVFAGACGDDRGTVSTDGGDQSAPVPQMEPDPAAGEEIVFSVEELAGFVTALDAVRDLPVFVAFGDGRVVQDTTEPLGSGEVPAVPTVEERLLTADGLTTLLERLAQAGVTTPVDYGRPPIADAGAVRLQVVVDDRVVDNTVEAPGFEAGFSAEQLDARAEVDRLLADLADLDGLVGDDVSAAEPARFDSWLAFSAATDRTATSGPGDADALLVADWPLGPDRAADAATPLVCTALEGADLDAVLDRAAGQFDRTRWERSDGAAVDLALRPALAGEDCTDFPEFTAR